VTETALRGRQAEARRNDAAILAAAQAVLMDDPNASIAAVVERAGVNVASLYRRFASKEALLRRRHRNLDGRLGLLPAGTRDLPPLAPHRPMLHVSWPSRRVRARTGAQV